MKNEKFEKIIDILDAHLNNYWNTISDIAKESIADEILEVMEDEKLDTRIHDEIWQKRNEYTRNHYGEFPIYLILDLVTYHELIKQCSNWDAKMLVQYHHFMGMVVATVQYNSDKIIAVAS